MVYTAFAAAPGLLGTGCGTGAGAVVDGLCATWLDGCGTAAFGSGAAGTACGGAIAAVACAGTLDAGCGFPASTSTVATWSGSLLPALALALSGPTLSVVVFSCASGWSGIFRLTLCSPVSLPGLPEKNIGTKMIANAINTAAPSRRVFRAGSMAYPDAAKSNGL